MLLFVAFQDRFQKSATIVLLVWRTLHLCRLNSAFTARGLAGGSCMVTLTKMQPLQSGNMLKSTEQSRAYLSDVPCFSTAASLGVHFMDESGAHELAPSSQALGQHAGSSHASMDVGRSPQQQAAAGAAVAAQTGGSCDGKFSACRLTLTMLADRCRRAPHAKLLP